MKFTQRDQLPRGVFDLVRLSIERSGGKIEGQASFYTDRGHNILRSIETQDHGRLLHVSISHPDRYPTWEEIKEAKDYFFGDEKDAIMVFPRRELWVNIAPNCFHLWELPRIPGPTGRWEYM